MMKVAASSARQAAEVVIDRLAQVDGWRPSNQSDQVRLDALGLLNHLKGLVLPVDHMDAARAIIERCALRLPRRGYDGFDDPVALLAALCDIQRELIALGAAPDAELQRATVAVTSAFPDARLVELRK